MPTTYDPPVITDFGAARLGRPGQKHSGDVMPSVFRAPEVIAEMEWDSQIDIWSVGVMVCFQTAAALCLSLMYFVSGDLESVRGWQPVQSRQGRTH